MTHRYDHAIAHHYAAFRPPLHEVILQRLVPASDDYANGLDVGCGTGRSAVALARHCRRVTAIDPSPAMLALAGPHPHITYLATDCAGLVQRGASPFACITFAGSLCYAKGPPLRTALPRLLATDGHILIYDFEVLLDEATNTLGLDQPKAASGYDHALGLDDWPEFSRVMQGADSVQLDLSAEQLAHLVLANSDRYDWLQRTMASADLFHATAHRLEEMLGRPQLHARIFFAKYQLASRPARPPEHSP